MEASDRSAGISMRGAGYYSEHTAGAARAIETAIPLALEAVGSIPFEDGAGAFGIADFGAADGGTSLSLHRALIAALRARTGRQITLTYTDLPDNDFSSLFRRVLGVAGGTAAPLADEDSVFVLASGTSFHRQVVPDASLHLGFSATAMHWLSRRPAMLRDHVHSVGATGEALDAFRAQAASDWTRILLARASELAQGGRLVLVNFCVDEVGRYLGNTGGRNMHERFGHHWRALHEAGRIDEAELERATFPQHYRTVGEFRAPFDDPASSVSRAGLRLERCFTRVTPCPYAERFAAGQAAGDFARDYVPTLRSWSESMFAGALHASRPEVERRAIIDGFYDAYRDEVASAPAGHGMDYVHCFMVIAKASS